MLRKIISRLIWMMLVVGMLAFNIQLSKCFYCPSGTIYIRPDGSVDPPTAPILRDEDVYTFTDNINDSIVVERDNIVIDGAGYTLQKTGSETGIDLSERYNVTVKNMEIKAFLIGILLERSSICIIFGNNIANNEYGVLLVLSSDNSIYHNNFVNNKFQADTDMDSVNVWDSGCEGNYWSDHDGTEFDDYGIGKVPYTVDENNTDYCPLMSPYMLGDVNHDGKVNIVDLYIIAKAYGTPKGELNWNPHADSDENGEINIIDISTVASHFGKTL